VNLLSEINKTLRGGSLSSFTRWAFLDERCRVAAASASNISIPAISACRPHKALSDKALCQYSTANPSILRAEGKSRAAVQPLFAGSEFTLLSEQL